MGKRSDALGAEFRNLGRAGRRQWPRLGVALIALVAIVVAFWPIAFVVSGNAYLAAIVPTLAGVLASAPVAYWAILVGQDAERESDSRRRTFSLELIRLELEGVLGEMRGDRAARPRPLLFPPLRTETWSRLAGTDLRVLGGTVLVDTIANAYHRIASTNGLEREWLAVGNEVLIGDQVYTGDRIRNALERGDKHTMAAVDLALWAIHQELRPGEPYPSADAAPSGVDANETTGDG